MEQSTFSPYEVRAAAITALFLGAISGGIVGTIFGFVLGYWLL